MHDVFISHASEDKESVVLPLSEILKSYGISVWLDINEIGLGTGLRRRIDHGLANSKFGVVILSPSFFNKEWTQKELDALVSREDGKHEIILPVLHNLSRDDVKQRSPLLADKLSVATTVGLDKVAKEIVQVVTKSVKSISSSLLATTVIGISGASCSGKSWFADKIRQLRPNEVTVFDLDSYYKEHSYVSTLEHKHDNPDSLNFDDAIAHLTLLKSGKDILVPVYDFETHSVKGEKLCKHNPLIVVEGIFVFFNPWFRKQLDIKVWVSAERDLKLDRRLRRDTTERGRTTEEVLDRYAKDVGPGFHKFIQPLKSQADIIYENNGRDKDKLPKAVELLIAYATR
jgi:uridine kinase